MKNKWIVYNSFIFRIIHNLNPYSGFALYAEVFLFENSMFKIIDSTIGSSGVNLFYIVAKKDKSKDNIKCRD